ncbi:Fe2+-dependent dioxygenase [Alteromonas sp. ASW11-19]|uniref:Fe2+-dependent dioxygenase n=1 Tax=Alteromonas salexigens TaxID=2982530 RepID=A0ABT2VJQ2_9ALTE|nr:Fe2+-dependent dioxygenase [Alteromonas salexigens]MCU7553446.1 Fe2+-dependent dioxygenase [Alteromonas salexigens]
MIVIDNLLTLDEVQYFRDALASVPFQDGKNTAMGMAAGVKNNGQADAQHNQVQQLANALLAKLGNHPQVVSAALPQRIFPPCFNRYTQSQTYGDHVDAAIMRIPHSPEVLRSDMSMTVFLTEPETYDGGELVIQTGFGEQRVKCAAGSAVLYPSSSLHKVMPVTRGERIAAITWMQSMVADPHIRETLYQLDQSIQSLINSGNADRQELDELHHVYHNLIRHFAAV